MNAVRRKEISKIKELLESLMSDIEGVKDDEESALENMPENLKESDRATEMQDYIDNLEMLWEVLRML